MWWPFGGGATEESATDRDGFMSYSAEVHAVGNGIFKGFVDLRPAATEPDSKRERHYFRGGYVVGRLVAVCLAVLLGSQAL